MHRTHNRSFELQKGQRLLSAVVQFTQHNTVNTLHVDDAEKFPLYIYIYIYIYIHTHTHTRVSQKVSALVF